MSIPFTWIYLLYDPFTGFYKIGKSDNPRERFKSLTRKPTTILAAPNNYVLVEAWLCPEKTENELHQRHAGARRHGEWFELTSDDTQTIELLGNYILDSRR